MRCAATSLLQHSLACAARASTSQRRRSALRVSAAGSKRRQHSGEPSGGGSGGGAGGSKPSAAATALPAAAAASGTGPLTDRRLLAEKLTAAAKSIEWTDPPGMRPAEATRDQVDALQDKLGYRFKNRYLLRLALVHSSAAPTTHNGIMAWIGDAALYLVVAEEVSAALGNVAIGKLSEVRKTLIGRAMCERYANHLGLGQYLVVGKSVKVQKAGQPSANMLAEMFEAVMGAVYLDGDLEAVRRCYVTHFPLPEDPLSLLQSDGTGGIPSGGSSSGEAAILSPWD